MECCLLSENAVAPKRATPGSAGYDLCTLMDVEIPTGARGTVHTGVCLRIPDGYYGRVAARSGLAFKCGLTVGAGVVDSDYRGPITLMMFNQGETPIKLSQGERVAQIVIEKIATPEVKLVSAKEWEAICNQEKTENLRGSGGFGSTGQF